MIFRKENNKQSSFISYLIIIIFIFLIRSPFFFIDYLDSDEATLILKGLSITKGNIPYVEFHNYKPPISGYFLTVPIFIAGNSLLAIRIFTSLIVSLSSIFLFKICLSLRFSKINAILCCFIFGITASFITRSIKSQSFYSEHISVMIILICIYLFLNSIEKKNNISFSIQGFLLGIATLNTPYLGIFSCLYVLFPILFIKDSLSKKLIYSFLIVLGGLSVLLIFVLYFFPKFPEIIHYIYRAGTSEILYSLSETIYKLIGAGLHVDSPKFFSAFIIWGLGFFGLIHIIYSKNFEQKNLVLISSLLILSLCIILTHYPSGRYLIIIAPFYNILLMYLINIKFFSNFKFIKIFILTSIFLFPAVDWYKNLKILYNKELDNNTLTYGRCTMLLRQLEKNNLLNKKIYFQDCHIIYFLKNQLPLLNFYHPGDIYYEERMSAFDKKYLGDEIFREKPEVLVIPELNDFINNLKFNKIDINNVLLNYELLFKESNFFIYQRKVLN